jgi:hypothetical protein
MASYSMGRARAVQRPSSHHIVINSDVAISISTWRTEPLLFLSYLRSHMSRAAMAGK